MDDYSINYTEDNRGYIFFNLVNQTVKFKPFIDSFSFTFTSNISSDEALNIYNRETLVDSYSPAEYSLKFNVVATNVNEAIENHKKFQKLLRMILPMKAESLDTPKKITALFSNLISSTGQSGVNYFDKSRAFDCIISDLNYTPDMEMGFFEYNGLFFAKAYSLDIKMSSTEKSSKEIDNVPYFKSGFHYGRKSKIQGKIKTEETDEKVKVVVEKSGDTDDFDVDEFLAGFDQNVSVPEETNTTNTEQVTNTKPPSTDQQEDTDTTGVDIQIENTQDEVPTTEDTGGSKSDSDAAFDSITGPED